MEEQPKDHLERIRRLAIAKWSDEPNYKGRPAWEARIVDAYTQIENAQHPEEEPVIANKRRSQIMRAFERGVVVRIRY